MALSYSFAIDWANNGDFTGTGENVTARVLGAEGVVIDYGRDQARALSPAATGSAAFQLLNTSRDYSPENSSSPLVGLILPARPVRLQATVTPTTYTLFRGHVDEFTVLPARGERKVSVTCLDALAKIKEAKATTTLYPSIRTGEAIAAILDSIGWSGAARDLDTGSTTLRWWCADGTEAWAAILAIVAAEGSPALITVDSSGNIVFRDRHHRLTRTASTTSQVTFRDTGAEPLFSAPLVYDIGWRDVVNDVAFDVEERGPEAAETVIWSTDQTYTIGAGGSVTVSFTTDDPFYDADIDVGDWTVLSGSAGIIIDTTQGRTATLTLTSGTGGVVTDIQVRGHKVGSLRTLQVTASDAMSITTYGSKSGPSDAGQACVEDAQAIANLAVLTRKVRLPIVSLDVIGSDATPTRLTQCLTRNLSDRATIVDAETGLNRDFYIEQIRHEIREAGIVHTTTFGCEAVPATAGMDDPATVFIFDHATNGKFGTGRFAT